MLDNDFDSKRTRKVTQSKYSQFYIGGFDFPKVEKVLILGQIGKECAYDYVREK